MTPADLLAARLSLDMTQQQLADALQLSSRRVIIGYEKGEHAIPGPVQVAIRLMLDAASQKRGS